MKSIKFFLLSSLMFLGGLFAAQSQEVEPYFSVDQLPDLIKCLPAPPDTTSITFSHDVMRYFWGKTQRLDPERSAMARRDAVWGYEPLLNIFSEPFGMHISKTETPEIWNLMVTSLTTTDQMRVAPKKFFMRKRPFVRFKEHILTYGAEEDEEELGSEGSYPSGHTARSWAAAMLLAEINPANANDIFARAWAYGESRVIVGAHWQSDVDASRVAASIGFSQLHNSPEFCEQMARAKAEFNRLSGAAVATDDSSDFVRITDVVPDAILEIRYHTTYNFVGERIDGYQAPIAMLTREAATALKAVSDDLKAQGYRLKIFDAYRPQRAVDHFMRWAEDLNATEMKQYFYPELNKNVLIPDYVARKSGHTRGSTVDLTLFDMRTEKEVDMGCTFDWFGVESHPDFCGNPETGKYTGGKSKAGRSITAEQFHNRMILRQAMLRHGFKPLDTEWWHFTLKNEPFPNTYFTFPLK
ncbi:MAG: phosphatase PAP2 family protein [Muribaculaceae bacterium]|nr:phosphatase PAP2 family protein [Muribaculaceae bacterium]